MHPINLGEVLYRIGRTRGWARALRIRDELTRLAVDFVPFSDVVLLEAARLKTIHAIAYADCFAAALALVESATLLTSDPEFDRIGDALPRIRV